MLRLIAQIGERAARTARVAVPDPYVIGILLSAATLVAGFLVGKQPASALLSAFGLGVLQPDLIAFAFQMVLVLLTGNAIAQAPVVARGIRALADRPTNSRSAAALTALVAMALSLFNWGLGLVGGALFAREIARSFKRRGLPFNYGVIGAAGYMGIAVWHGGLSGSAPLKVAADGPFGPAIPITSTIFAPSNIVITLALVVAFCALFAALGGAQPDANHPTPPSPTSVDPNDAPPVGAERLERSLVVLALLGAPLSFTVVHALWSKGAAAINLDWVILLFFIVGMAVHRTPRRYAEAFGSGAREAAGILLQFPLYFGIIAVARDSGLVDAIARAFAAAASSLPVSPERAAPLITYLSACIINIFVPSGGGQWAVQSPVILEMAKTLSLDRAPLVLAFAYGDQTTNLLQPFWALPLLSVTGLRARDVMGFTLVALAVELVIVSAGLMIFA